MLTENEKTEYVASLRAELKRYDVIIEDVTLPREERLKAAERREIVQAVGLQCYTDGKPMKRELDRLWAEGYTIPWRSGKAWFIRKDDSLNPKWCSASRLHDRREWDYVRMLAEGEGA